MTIRDIRAHLREIYGVKVSPDLISRVTDAVVEELAERQSRPLDASLSSVRRVGRPVRRNFIWRWSASQRGWLRSVVIRRG
jgi:transposase-like protein